MSRTAILESAISNMLAKSTARADAIASLRPVPRSVPSDADMYALIQSRKRQQAKQARARRRSAAQDIRTRLLVSPADVMRRFHDLRDVSTFTRSECLMMAWHEAKCRTFKNWAWLSDHHQEAAKLTRLLMSRELAAMQMSELRQTGWHPQPECVASRDEINRLKMSLSIIVSHICNTNGE